MSNKANNTVTWAGSTACYHTHEPMLLGDFEVYGGSGYSPKIKDADYYVDLNPGAQKADNKIMFPIMNMGVPKEKEFTSLIAQLAIYINDGKKIHIGCIGGHGRTGLILVGLADWFGVSDDPIAYVRDNYCHKAVESQKQIDFLVELLGCPTAEPTKKFTLKKSNRDFDEFLQRTGDFDPIDYIDMDTGEIAWAGGTYGRDIVKDVLDPDDPEYQMLDFEDFPDD